MQFPVSMSYLCSVLPGSHVHRESVSALHPAEDWGYVKQGSVWLHFEPEKLLSREAHFHYKEPSKETTHF